MDKGSECKHDLHAICGKLCGYDNITTLITRLALIEGSILERLEKDGVVALRELMEEEAAAGAPCAVAMAVGSLVRQGLIKSAESGENVFVKAL